MILLFKLCGCALIGTVCAMMLKGTAKSVAAVVAIFSSLLILGAVIGRFSGALQTVNELVRDSGVEGYGEVMLKALGIGIVVNTVGNTCRDMGESSIASGVELAGKIEMLLICLPVITDTLSLIKELLL